ncbi:DUF3727 domain-containing protein [Vacuolonema iberomarrocanum]|uniref:DUF3727 domain-containing protein n=1 Tax=Vacuolonema iberomarrocanum TaxID=3454632 RepID=UPI001A03B3EC|nr:DUF3727 domain-containing protein [filamentous cyanobacterium LEGE 07170]
MDDKDLDERSEQPPTVEIFDDKERSLVCFVEHSLEIDEKEYLLLLPVDSPVEIFAWMSDDEDEDEDEELENLIDLTEDDIDEIFSTAKAVLAEQDLLLQRTAHTLSVKGELPEADEESIIILDLEEEDDDLGTEQFQRLAYFYHNDQEYEICTPLDPLLFFARYDDEGNIHLLAPDEFKGLRSQLEAQLFDSLE